MFLRPLLRRRHISRHVLSLSRASSTRASTAPFPITHTCPSPTCSCSPMPELPEGLEIDHSKPLNGTMAPYAEQVLICTGKDNWMSRIEEENSGDNLAADIKELLGRGGTYSDPFHNVSVINASFPSSIPTRREIQTTSAYILPSFKYIPFLPRVSFTSVEAMIKGYLLPTKLNPAHDNLSPIHRDRLSRSKEYQNMLYGVQDVKDLVVLICGHGGRDMRCGVLGPVLKEEFERCLPDEGFELPKGPVAVDDPEELRKARLLSGGEADDQVMAARLGLISHIGGHKFAGNVIIYIPPHMKMRHGKAHHLAGCGIWYGRVEPMHVQGLIRETVLEGRVIKDLFRGGVRQGGEILRI